MGDGDSSTERIIHTFYQIIIMMSTASVVVVGPSASLRVRRNSIGSVPCGSQKRCGGIAGSAVGRLAGGIGGGVRVVVVCVCVRRV